MGAVSSVCGSGCPGSAAFQAAFAKSGLRGSRQDGGAPRAFAAQSHSDRNLSRQAAKPALARQWWFGLEYGCGGAMEFQWVNFQLSSLPS